MLLVFVLDCQCKPGPHAAADGRVIWDSCRNRLVAQSGIGTVPLSAINSANPANAGFRAFRGGGRRLGDG